MDFYKKIIKPEIRSLVRIKDTFDERFEYLRLDKNERLHPFNEELFLEFKESIRPEHLSGYFELGSTYKRLSEFVGVKPEQLFLGAGSDLALKSVYEACVGRGDGVILPWPCYAMNTVYANMFGAEMKLVGINESWHFDIGQMLSKVDDDTKILLLENPNGVAGTKPTKDEIHECARFLLKRGVILLVDEAYLYIESNRSHTCEIIEEYPNVIIAQSFSKAPGLAGLRVGYLVGEAKLIQYISHVRPMHEISSLSALAVGWVLDHVQLIEEYRRGLLDSKAYLKENFAAIGVEYRDTHANFILGFLPDEGRSRGMTVKLKKAKILAKGPFEHRGLRGWMRFTVGTRADSERLVEAIKACFSKAECI